MDSAARYELNGPGNGQISGSGIKQPHGKYSVHRILTPLFPHANELHPVAVADNLQHSHDTVIADAQPATQVILQP